MAILQSSINPKESIMSDSESYVLKSILKAQQLAEGYRALDHLLQLDESRNESIRTDIGIKKKFLLDQIASALQDPKGLPKEYRNIPEGKLMLDGSM